MCVCERVDMIVTMENVYFTVGHGQEQHLKNTGLEKLKISVFILCWGYWLGGCEACLLESPAPQPPPGCSDCPSLPLRTKAGGLVVATVCSGGSSPYACCTPLTRPITSALPRGQPRLFLQDSLASTPGWQAVWLLLSQLSPRHSGIAADSAVLKPGRCFIDWGPWVPGPGWIESYPVVAQGLPHREC